MEVNTMINRKNIYLFGLFLMITALPLSKFMMSVAGIILALNWLIDPKVPQKFKTFFRNKAAVIIVSLYLLHVVGLLWTTDFDYALKDLRTKLPILALPVILSSSPALNRKQFHTLLLFFIAANLAGSFFSVHELVTKELTEIRKASIFISHIRFSLDICIAVFSGIYLVIRGAYPLYFRIVILVVIIWLAVFLTLIEAMTGLVILFAVSMAIILVWALICQNRTAKIAVLALLVAIPMVLFFYIYNIYRETLPKEPLNLATLDKFTENGNPYTVDTSNLVLENGYYVGIYIQEDELRDAWNARSKYDFDGNDSLGNELKYTLFRFLTSKGLRKDSRGLRQLSDKEVNAVEKGIADVDRMKESSVKTRIKVIFWEFQMYFKKNEFSGHSVTQRIEFWHASLRLIAKHFWFGVGTGDIKNAFAKEYDEMNSSLAPEVRWRSHNQYLSIFVAFGLAGFLIFLFVLFAPAYYSGMYKDYFYMVFMGVLLLSMLTEDTIESQAGVTFYAFFTSFFLFARSAPESLFRNNKETERFLDNKTRRNDEA